MFGKTDLLETLSRDLGRARKRRDGITSEIAALTAQIAELEVQLSAENDRRERERAASEIGDIKRYLRDLYLAFTPAIAGMREATERAAAIVPEAHQFTDFLQIMAAEVTKATDALLDDLDGRIGALHVGFATPEQSFSGSNLEQDNDRDLLCLPEWLAQRKAKSTVDRCCAEAA
jgi:chromosome segregation ATPase